MAKSNLAARLAYLVSQEGSIRAASRKTGIPRTTFKRILDGSEPTAKNRTKVNRQFRRLAPEEVKRREKRGLGAGAALVDEATARELEASYRRRGIDVRVYARRDFTVDDNGTEVAKVAYGQGTSVDQAKNTMNANFTNYLDNYRAGDFSLKSAEEAQYRVIGME